MGNRRFLLLATACLAATSAHAQQVTVGTQFHRNSDSFFENTGVNFGFNIPGSTTGRGVVGLNAAGVPGGPIRFQQGGAPAAQAPLGATPNGASFGYQVNSSLGEFNFGITADQGDSRGNVSQAADVTTQNGLQAFISDTSQRPFVTSVVPVIGGFADASQPHYTFPAPAPPVSTFGNSALAERLQRLGEAVGPRVDPKPPVNFTGVPAPPKPPSLVEGPATRPASSIGTASAAPSSASGAPVATLSNGPLESVKDIRANQAAADAAANEHLLEVLAQAQQALAAGKPSVARIYYSQLARQATGELKQAGIDGLKATEK